MHSIHGYHPHYLKYAAVKDLQTVHCKEINSNEQLIKNRYLKQNLFSSLCLLYFTSEINLDH